MGGLCSCFRGPDDEEEGHAGSLESTSHHGISLHCFQFLRAYNVLFQRGHVFPVSSANQGRATVVPSSSDDSSISHTYHPPPRPLPYDYPRCSHLQPQSRTTELMLGKVASHCHEASELRRSNDVHSATEDLKNTDYDKFSKKNPSESSVKQPKKQTRSAFNYIFPLAEDEDVCPTCLEEYTAENPKITLLCSHHFHLSCIYEWMERSENCPFCGKVMVFNESQ